MARHGRLCRCAACLEHRRAVQRAWSRSKRQREAAAVGAGMLPVYCWCERHIVHVDPAVIKAARTESCGRYLCREQEATG